MSKWFILTMASSWAAAFGIGIVAAPSARGSATGDSKLGPTDLDLGYFRQARKAVERGDLTQIRTLNFIRFRRGSMLQAGPMGADRDNALERTLNQAEATGVEARVLEAARAVVQQDASCVRAHALLGAVLAKEGNPGAAQGHRTFIKGTFDSILASGDGRSKSTAFVVFHLREERDLIRAAGLEIVRQGLEEQGRRTYDAVTVRPRPDQRASISLSVSPNGTVFFDITEPYALEAKAFQK